MRKQLYRLFVLIFLISILTGCGGNRGDESVIKEIETSQTEELLKKEVLTVEEKMALVESQMEPLVTKEEANGMPDVYNTNPTLSVPTDAEKIDGLYFIVDCYHNQVVYNDKLDAPLTQWHVMCNEMSEGHTIASDGKVYLIDDTENNRILVYQKMYDKFIHTQTLSNIGKRPHYVRYDEKTKSFYVLSSMTGEVYVLKSKAYLEKGDKERLQGDGTLEEVYLTDVKEIDSIKNTYCRSFSIAGDKMFFPASNGLIVETTFPECVQVETYQVPDEVAGLAQIYPIGDYYYLTVSTNREGDQAYATIIRAKSLKALQSGQYEDLYDIVEADRPSVGTPYHISTFDNHFYLVEHRHGHGLFQFDVSDNQIVDVQILH